MDNLKCVAIELGERGTLNTINSVLKDSDVFNISICRDTMYIFYKDIVKPNKDLELIDELREI